MARTTVATPDPDEPHNPTQEIGHAGNSIAPWDSFSDASEEVPELRFPHSVRTYDKMRNDEQIASLLASFIGPILGYHWYIDPNGARDETVEHVAHDFGLEIDGQEPGPQGRLRDRFGFGDYLYHCLLKIPYGFLPFEQVYRFGDDEKYHIRKLAPRMPGSIQQIQTARDGGLEYIRQYPAADVPDLVGNSRAPVDLFGENLQAPAITVDRLVMHVNEKEGGNWFGRSWLRSLYRSWVIKDRLLRVDALKHERNGMGVPTGKSAVGTTQSQLRELLRTVTKWKAGETSAAALPPGTDIELKGVQGALPDTLASVKYHNEQMARRFFAMFSQLGSTETGARALGETFVDFFALMQASVAKGIAEDTTAYAIEDLVDINYSIDESAPILQFKVDSDRQLATADLVSLIQSGAITVDPELERYIRSAHDLPELTTASDQRPPQARSRERLILNSAKQREPTDIEEQSEADYAAIRKAFNDALSDLVEEWKTSAKGPQVNELVALVASTDPTDLEALAGLQATPRGADTLSAAAIDLAAEAADRALQELKDQGSELDSADLSDFNQLLTDRAAAVEVVMANGLSQSASAAALAGAGGDISAADLAMAVGDHLDSLSDAYLNDQLGGALMQAQNGARLTVFASEPEATLYSSELADTPNCCDPCSDVDGTDYKTAADALKDYPVAGFRDCEGTYRCRGTVVAVLGETAPSVQE